MSNDKVEAYYNEYEDGIEICKMSECASFVINDEKEIKEFMEQLKNAYDVLKYERNRKKYE